MNIAILGGTGKEGAGLAMRWAQAGHSIIIGSRDAERARAKAAEMCAASKTKAITGDVEREPPRAWARSWWWRCRPTAWAPRCPRRARGAAARWSSARSCRSPSAARVCSLRPPVGSSAEEVQSLLPEARVVAAFHHIAAHELADTEHPIECDLLLCGQDAEAKETVAELGRSLGLRPIDVGALTNAGPLEGITAVLATINRRYKLKNSGIKITGL